MSLIRTPWGQSIVSWGEVSSLQVVVIIILLCSVDGIGTRQGGVLFVPHVASQIKGTAHSLTFAKSSATIKTALSLLNRSVWLSYTPTGVMRSALHTLLINIISGTNWFAPLVSVYPLNRRVGVV